MKRICLLFTFHFLLLTLVVSCGRRGEPVPIMGREVPPAKAPSRAEEGLTGRPISPEERPVPGPPTGLMGLYTGGGVVLTWDEITGQEIRFYNVYRSSGSGFELIGDSITPAFIDRDVEPDRRYLYRVTAVADTEGPPSRVIEILTRVR